MSKPLIHLGFTSDEEPLDPFTSIPYPSWDGGKIGGKPFNLLPSNPLPLVPCPKCSDSPPMQFLLQIYAPADDVCGPQTFHRMLYVFCCATKNCDGVKVLRCQEKEDNKHFPKSNEVISKASINEPPPPPPSTPFIPLPSLCALCGLSPPKSLTCPAQKLPFCSRSHQKEYNSRVTKPTSVGSPPIKLKSVFEEICIVVEEEESDEGGDNVDIEAEMKKLGVINAKLENDDVQVSDPEVAGSGQDVEEIDDEKMDQKDMNDITGSKGVDDDVTIHFLATIGKEKSQILRYSRWNPSGVLWTSSRCTPDVIPRCEECGGERKFEFQVMPQLLNYLEVDEEEKPVVNVVMSKSRFEWGTIAVFSCVGSCGKSGGGYCEEYAWVQPPI
ncbi:hypothetical protein TrST_g11274 [Triparma strigata]|uniref:Programmed cell death protein 2 C-terminal domain-containing protein n=1 Tax=Triparma strigata TaxID=1606541 RepID=A0A9W7A7A1_9STRA|nr:hypothetical protein TrST_g11274 [Triparma strigata]